MPAAKLTRADREHVKATYIATGSDAAETAKRHGLLRSHVDQLAKRGDWPRPRAGKTREQQDAVSDSRAIIQVSAGVRQPAVSAGDAIAASIADNRSASSLLVHAENRRALEALSRRKKPVPIRNMRDLGEAAKIAEPREASPNTLIQFNIL